MPCHVAKSTSVSSRRHQALRRFAPLLLPLAMLDLSKPSERAAHDFLIRATSKRDRMWKLIDLRRQESTLLCVVQWARRDNADKTFSVAEVSLKEAAVCWRDYATARTARTELERRCTEKAESAYPT